MKPIETRYAGHRFRSRLEARWAVFFDALSIRWEYETQGYVITDPYGEQTRLYLPDFYLPDLDAHAEVKGDPKAADWTLWCMAVDSMSGSGLPDSKWSCSGLGRPGGALIILGNIPPQSERAWLHPFIHNQKAAAINAIAFGPQSENSVSLIYTQHGRFDPLWAGWNGTPDWLYDAPDHAGEPASGSWKTYADPRVTAAYNKARQARFEHGVSG